MKFDPKKDNEVEIREKNYKQIMELLLFYPKSCKFSKLTANLKYMCVFTHIHKHTQKEITEIS